MWGLRLELAARVTATGSLSPADERGEYRGRTVWDNVVWSEKAKPRRKLIFARLGLDLLRGHLKECVGFHAAGEGAISARARHLEALRRARAHVEEAHRLLTARHAGELVAQELTDAQKALGEITGEVTSEELLGRIFGSFCIGK
jgi:tRNA U34 5-carboxymethylaminomethyl modifying GTPase MnmE/TrmE